MNDFNGVAEIHVYDKFLATSTLGNDNNTPIAYGDYSNLMFSGRATVKNGAFKTDFIVPHDIRYNTDFGKIFLYAYSTENDKRQAAGSKTDILIGEFNKNAVADNKGPEISLYLNHENFKSGETTGSTPLLFAKIKDDSGINVGCGIGHDILLTIDGNPDNVIVLNNYFSGDLDNFKSGIVIYQLPELEAGKHEITLKAWDNHNNSSIAKINFTVGKTNELKIMNFVLHPVPVSRFGTLNFSFETDEPNSALNITVEGINYSGAITGKQKIDIVSYGSLAEETQVSLPSIGIKNPGVYFIRLTITTNKGKKGQFAQKIIVNP
jgi:hypothetical protein